MEFGEVVLMEGAFGSQLVEHVGDIVDGDPLWCSRFIHTHRQQCLQAHRDLIGAGTEIVTSGSYQASVEGYMKHLKVDKEKAVDLIRDSVRLCKEAIQLEEQAQGKKLKVYTAGSVGPYGAFLHDGSDYTGQYPESVTQAYLEEWHKQRFEALIEAGADLIGFETIPCLLEAFSLISLLKKHPKVRAWLSFSCKDSERISSGENFYDVALACWKLADGQLVAVGANCFHPSLATKLFSNIRKNYPDIPLIVYPNSGEIYSTQLKRWLDKESNKSLTDYTQEWLDFGIKFIGGCCRTNARDVKQYREEINKWKETHSK